MSRRRSTRARRRRSQSAVRAETTAVLPFRTRGAGVALDGRSLRRYRPPMADEPDNVVLMLLRRIDAKLDRVIEDVQDLKIRMTNVEERLAAVEMSIAGVQRRIDRVETRLDRIEKRLDLVDAAH
jgi:hypothetical protein